MRGWLLAGLLLASLASFPTGTAQGGLDGPTTVSLQVTEGGVPVEGYLHASQQVDGVWRWSQAQLVDGKATLHVQDGRLEVGLRGPPPEDRLHGYGELTIAGDADFVVDLADAPPSVPVDLRFVDDGTGVLLPVDLYAVQMLFGDYLCIGTRPTTGTAGPAMSGAPPSSPPPQEPCDLQWAEPGRLVGRVPPGILSLRAESGGYSMCAASVQDRASACEMHAPASRSLAAVAGSSLDVTIPLLAVPAPDADVEGYLISNVTGEAIPRKYLAFQGSGEFATVYFGAYLDEDGSYRLRIPAGRYSVRGDVCGHDQRAVVFEAVAGQTTRLDLVLYGYGKTPTSSGPATTAPDGEGMTPSGVTSSSPTAGGGGASATGSGSTEGGGPVSYPACDYTPSPMSMAPEGGAGSPEPTGSGSEDVGREPTVQVVGLLAVIDFGGGLGPLGGVVQDDGQDEATLEDADGSRGSDDPLRFIGGASAVTLAVALLALAVRRRLR